MFAMAANKATEETDLVSFAVAWLRERLPAGWIVEVSKREFSGPGYPAGARADAAIDVRTPNGHIATLVVETKRALAPKAVDSLLPYVAQVLRTLAGDTPVLVVAPWLSARTRALLEERGLNYIDQTGNGYVALANPAVFIRTEGATRDPAPAERGRARVRGPKAGRLIRTLVDIRPPYGVRELAAAVGLAPGYVSRLLDALDAEALVERRPRGEIVRVDIRGLLRRWAETYDVFKSNPAATFLAPGGAAKALTDLASVSASAEIAVTGSYAAVRLAPVAAPALLLCYTNDGARIADVLGLLPADKGVNVALLRPFDEVVWNRTTKSDGVRYVAPSQIVVDCSTGPGRMPAEAEAVMGWMLEDESRWRATTLHDVGVALGAT